MSSAELVATGRFVEGILYGYGKGKGAGYDEGYVVGENGVDKERM